MPILPKFYGFPFHLIYLLAGQLNRLLGVLAVYFALCSPPSWTFFSLKDSLPDSGRCGRQNPAAFRRDDQHHLTIPAGHAAGPGRPPVLGSRPGICHYLTHCLSVTVAPLCRPAATRDDVVLTVTDKQ